MEEQLQKNKAIIKGDDDLSYIYVAFRQIVTMHQRRLVSHYRPMSDGKVTGDMVVLREASEIVSQESVSSPSCPAMNTQTHMCYKPVGL